VEHFHLLYISTLDLGAEDGLLTWGFLILQTELFHTSAGMGSLGAALVLGRRKHFGPTTMVPHNIPLATVGAAMLWFGWFGFNADNALTSGSLRVIHIHFLFRR
jgi:ammonium transporter family